jgi:hypothetical protein
MILGVARPPQERVGHDRQKFGYEGRVERGVSVDGSDGTNPFGQVSAGTVKMTTKTCPITTSMSVLRQQWGSWDIKAKGKPLTSVDFDLKYTAHEGFDVLAARGGFKLALVASSYHDLHLREYDLKEGRDTRDVFGLELYQA